MKRIFIENKFIQNKRIKLDSENLHYLKKVLRFSQQKECVVFNGFEEAEAIFEKDSVIIKKIKKTINEKTDLKKIAISSIKQSNFEIFLQKATELNIDEIFIIKSARSCNQININRSKKIIIEATKQCQRIDLMQLHEKIDLNVFLKKIKHNEWAYGSLKTENKKLNKNISGIIIGPEGGWNTDEEEMLKKKIEGIKLSENILKAETAGICASFLLNY